MLDLRIIASIKANRYIEIDFAAKLCNEGGMYVIMNRYVQKFEVILILLYL